MSQFFASGGQSIGVSASASIIPMNIQDWFPLGWTGWISSLSKGLSSVFSNTTVQKHQFLAFFIVQLSHPYMITGKTLIEDQGLIKVNLSAILDPFVSNQFTLCPWARSFFQKVVPCPLLSCYMRTQDSSLDGATVFLCIRGHGNALCPPCHPLALSSQEWGNF